MWLVVLLTALAIVTAAPTNYSDDTGSGTSPDDTGDHSKFDHPLFQAARFGEVLFNSGGSLPSYRMETALRKMEESTASQDEYLSNKWAGAVKECEKSQTCKTTFTEKGTEMEKVALGFEAAASLADGFGKVFDKSEAFGKIAGLLDKVAPYLGAAGAIVSIFTTFENSQEVQRLDKLTGIVNEGFNRVEGRFDQLEVQINDLKNVVEDLAFWRSVRPHVIELGLVKDKMASYYRAKTRAAQKTRRDDLTMDIYNKAHDALIKLRYAFNGEHTYKPVCEVVTRIAKVDKHKVIGVAMGLYSTMIQGAQHYLTIGNMLQRNDMQQTADEMVTMLVHIGGLIKDCEENITINLWLMQWKKDVKEFMTEYTDRGHEELMAHTIYGRLKDKYYWMDWIVVVYPNMEVNVEQRIWVKRISYFRVVQHTNWRGKYNVIVTVVSRNRRENDVSTSNLHFNRRDHPKAEYVYKQIMKDMSIQAHLDIDVMGVVLNKRVAICGESKFIKQHTATYTYTTVVQTSIYTAYDDPTNTYYKVFYLG